MEWRSEDDIAKEEKEDIGEDAWSDHDEDADERECLQELRDLGCLVGKVGPEFKQLDEGTIEKATEARDMRLLARGLQMISGGLRRQAAGMSHISEVLNRRPQLAPLAAILEPYKSQADRVPPPNLGQVGQFLEMMKPGVSIKITKGPEGMHECGECGAKFKSWGKCRSHVRTVHTGIVSKCPGCGKTYANDDSYKQHLKRCKSLK